jgi:NADH-quinone oxidoreductase subunit G
VTATEPTTGVPFTLNGVELEANQGELLIEACERQGVHIPRFCYHPRMTPVGMCRMCLVEVDTGRGPGLQPSCMLTVTPNMVVNTESEASKDAQDGVLELLLINHPLDCPVCDKGGECPLQDNAYSYGPGESRFVEEKRHYEKPIPISDLVYLDRERCILCDRCTRFADEVAGDPLIHFMDRGAQTQVNTFPEHPFSSYFSGNTVQICPVGALTAEPYRFKARPWDLNENESTSAVDSTGARIVLQASRDRLVRILGVDSDAVNWSWLSDKERFAYEAAESDERVIEPLVSVDGRLESRRWNDAVGAAVAPLSIDPDRIGVIGGARLPSEGQFAWAELLRDRLGITNIDAQLGDGLPSSVFLGLPRATIADAATPGGVVVLMGADPKEELPTLYLRLRHAATQAGTSIIELTPHATSLSAHAAVSAHPLPGQLGAVVSAMSAGSTDRVGAVSASTMAAIAELLGSGRPVTIVAGRGNLAESADVTMDALGGLLTLAPGAKVLSALRRGNVHGAMVAGLTPEVGSGLDTLGMLRAAADGSIDTLVLLGADPLADVPDRALVERAFEAVDSVIAVDAFLTASSSQAAVVLPAALPGEVDGSFVNLEGRLSPLRAKVTPPGQARSDWMIAVEVAAALGHDLDAVTLDEVRAKMSTSNTAFGSVDWEGLGSTGDGPLLDIPEHAGPEFGTPVVPPAPDGYGLRLVVDRKLWDLGTMVQQARSLRDLPPPAEIAVAAADFDALGVSDGSSVTVEWSGGSVSMAARRDAGLPRGACRIPFRLPGVDSGAMIDSSAIVSDIRLAVG